MAPWEESQVKALERATYLCMIDSVLQPTLKRLEADSKTGTLSKPELRVISFLAQRGVAIAQKILQKHRNNLPARSTDRAKSLEWYRPNLATPLKCPRMPSPETSRRNLAQARAKWRPPRPWRSPQETRVIKRLARQWFMDEEPRCPLRAIARRLGVSHTYVQKLVREFAEDPNTMLRQTGRPKRGYGMASVSASGRMQVPFERRSATFEQLNEAQAMSRKMRDRGWLRGPGFRSLRASDR
jgi:hypothetical protein